MPKSVWSTLIKNLCLETQSYVKTALRDGDIFFLFSVILIKIQRIHRQSYIVFRFLALTPPPGKVTL